MRLFQTVKHVSILVCAFGNVVTAQTIRVDATPSHVVNKFTLMRVGYDGRPRAEQRAIARELDFLRLRGASFGCRQTKMRWRVTREFAIPGVYYEAC
jgi:hypothetical protein